jgi:cellulose biosynthesis protein BcsQ
MTQVSRTPRTQAKRLAIFNHKGGVGKTTLAVNIAYALARLEKRVLLVDSDPQCNLTAHFIEEGVVNKLLDSSDSSSGRTLWSALKPIAEATGDVKSIPPYELRQNLWLLPGDIRLAEFEQELNDLWSDSLQRKLKGFRGTTSLSALVNETCRAYKIDYVFYDCGPNIGPLNRIVLLDCDYFIVPSACDLFSLRAIKAVGHTLGNWIQTWSTISNLAPTDFDLFLGRPKFIGYIPQRFRVYAGGPAGQYLRFFAKIEKTVSADVIEVLNRIDPKLVIANASPRLGEVKDFGVIAAASQEQGVPIPEVNAGTAEQRDEALKSFLRLAQEIIRRTGR